jgi:hypothetical protein
MALQPDIALAGQPNYPTPQSLMSFSQALQQMQDQKRLRETAQKVQQYFQSHPDAIDQMTGITTPRAILDLSQIDRGYAEQASMNRSRLLQQDAAARAAEMKRAHEEYTAQGEVADDALAAAQVVWNDTHDQNKVKEAWNQWWDDFKTSGKADALHFKPDVLRQMTASAPNGDTIDYRRADIASRLKMSAEMALNKAEEGGDKPTTLAQIPDAKREEQEPQTATASGAQYRGAPAEQQPQGTSLADVAKTPLQEKATADEGPSVGGDIIAINSEGKPVYGKLETTKIESGKSKADAMYEAADKQDADALKDLRIGGEAGRKRAEDRQKMADHLRTQADRLVKQGQKDESLEIQRNREKRLQSAREGADIRPEDAAFIAQEVWAGNRQAATGFARNQRNQAAIAKAITDWGVAHDKSAKDLAATQAEYKGIEQAERSLGARSGAVELGIQTVKRFAPLVQAASAALKRTNIRSINDLYEALLSRTASPELRRLSAQINGFINIYARTVGGGTPHVDDKVHAREVLDRGFAHNDIMASVEALVSEMESEELAVPAAREGLTESFRERKGPEIKGKVGGQKSQTQGPLTPEERKRLEELRKKHGRPQE